MYYNSDKPVFTNIDEYSSNEPLKTGCQFKTKAAWLHGYSV